MHTLLLIFTLLQALASPTDGSGTFITDLMSRMTLEEKIGQLNQVNGGDIVTGAPTSTQFGKELTAGHVGAVLNTQGVEKIRALQKTAVEQTRLGIPLLVGLDVIHGYETLFPVPLGLSCTWDLPGIERSAQIAAAEAGTNGICWTFSPMVDIALDSRWGRQAEGAGEDPYLGSLVAQAMVRGYEGSISSDKKSWKKGDIGILSCVKHFALYGAAESGRDYNTVDMSRLRMYNQYLAPYKAAAEAGAGSFMTSFNIIDGMPATGNRWLLTDLLRKEWGWKGFVVTDYATIPEMKTWGVGDDKSNTQRAILAGTDMDMVSECFVRHLSTLVREGKVSEADIDQACRRVLEAKYRLGLFDDPYRFCNASLAQRLTYSQAHRDIARKLTAESFVLLKNQDNLLPLNKGTRVALIGPLADNRQDIAGTWSFSAKPDKYKTIREALAACGDLTLVGCCLGCNVLDDAHQQQTVSKGHGLTPIPWVDETESNAEALRIAREADVIICAMGESAWMSGEGTSRTSLEMPAPQRRLLQQLSALGKPIVLLNFAGRATCLSWESEHIPAIMNVWFGSECADALTDVLTGVVAPSGHLTVSMPKSTGQEPLYYNHLNTGRPVADDAPYQVFTGNYIDCHNGAIYPFGYGLTYTQFAISAPQSTQNGDRDYTVTCTLTNTGSREGDEVVQLYIRRTGALIALPERELKGFQRVHLKAGESTTVTFRLTPELLSYYATDAQGQIIQTSDFSHLDIMIGLDSQKLLTVEGLRSKV